MLDDFLRTPLSALSSENKLRKLPKDIRGLDFSSNDYLGLARSEELFNKIHEKITSAHLKKNGATGSRLLSGNSDDVLETEHKLAKIFQASSALIFNSGYTANLAVLSSIPQRGDTIIYDELAHTCIKDGARLSLANRYSFKHNDLNDLEKKLHHAKGKKFIAVESIYSMDGDQCPLNELVLLAKQHNAFIILDEAHSTGVMGIGGSGLATSLHLHHQVDIRIYTFGKAMGIHGACVAGSNDLIQYLINFARPFIYTTALPPHSITAIDCAFDYLEKHHHLQQIVQHKIKLFTESSRNLKNKTDSNSAIQTLVIPGNDNVKTAAYILQSKNFDIRPILSPTVAAGTERIRICLHTYNEDKHITDLVLQLTELSLTTHPTNL